MIVRDINQDIYLDNSWYTAILILEVMSFIFYTWLIYFLFKAYREFKALYLGWVYKVELYDGSEAAWTKVSRRNLSRVS